MDIADVKIGNHKVSRLIVSTEAPLYKFFYDFTGGNIGHCIFKPLTVAVKFKLVRVHHFLTGMHFALLIIPS